MTEPTDSELNELADAHTPNTETGALNYRKFARAVLAKWGTPAPVGVEPVAYCQLDDGNAAEAFSWPGTDRRPHHTTPLYTAPQPTQPQAGAVPLPLTPEQMAKLYRQSAMRDRIIVRGDWEQGVRDAEAAHGIKGGQHDKN